MLSELRRHPRRAATPAHNDSDAVLAVRGRTGEPGGSSQPASRMSGYSLVIFVKFVDFVFVYASLSFVCSLYLIYSIYSLCFQ